MNTDCTDLTDGIFVEFVSGLLPQISTDGFFVESVESV